MSRTWNGTQRQAASLVATPRKRPHPPVQRSSFHASPGIKLTRFAALLSAACLSCSLLSAQTKFIGNATDPMADEHAIVQAGPVRFTVLTPQLVRMEWAADGRFVNDPSLIFINRHLPVPPFTKKISGPQVTIDTAALHLVYRAEPAAAGFTAQNLAITLKWNGKPVTWHPGMAPTGNLLGTTRTLDGAQGADNLREPMGQGLVSRDGWAVVDDTGPLFDSADFGKAHEDALTQPWVKQRPAGSRADLYFFGYGHDYKQALADYVQVAGRIPLPPRFAFGSWWSRYWAYTDQELRELVEGFHQNSLPLDVFVIDMDWHQTFGRHFDQTDASGHSKGWSGYSWDPVLFPDPKDFLGELHDQGLKVTLNLHPASGVQPWEKAYPEFARKMGVDPASGKYIPFDLTNRQFAKNYLELLHHPLERQGVDFWWLDWQQESNTGVAGVNPTWWLNYIHFTDQEHEGKRPLLFHRWGGLGNHRYQIGFSGDTVSVWDSLAFQPWFTATAANVGYAYWSHDIGGHMPGKVDPELYARWIQFGIFSPILRTHTTKNAEAERRIWAYPEPYSDVMRQAFQLRYAMQPYIYTEARRTYDTGLAFDRPLYYDYPEAAEAYTAKNEYLFGDNLLVAPVVTPADASTGLAAEHVWLPQGEWIEWSSGARLRGPVSLDRTYSIAQLPVFVKAGTILPMQPPMLYTGQKPVDPLILTVYPLENGQTSRYTVYEDSGHGEDYQQNVGTARTLVEAHQNGEELTVTVAPVDGSYEGMQPQRRIELRLPADWPPEAVRANGVDLPFTLQSKEAGWRYDGNTLTTIVPVAAADVHAHTTISIRRGKSAVAKRAELNGFAGRMVRLRMAYDQLSADYPATVAVPDAITLAMQTGNRIGYHPQTAPQELSAFAKSYAEATATVQHLAADNDTATKPTAGAPAVSAEQAEAARSHQAHVRHALADLESAR